MLGVELFCFAGVWCLRVLGFACGVVGRLLHCCWLVWVCDCLLVGLIWCELGRGTAVGGVC